MRILSIFVGLFCMKVFLLVSYVGNWDVSSIYVGNSQPATGFLDWFVYHVMSFDEIMFIVTRWVIWQAQNYLGCV